MIYECAKCPARITYTKDTWYLISSHMQFHGDEYRATVAANKREGNRRRVKHRYADDPEGTIRPLINWGHKNPEKLAVSRARREPKRLESAKEKRAAVTAALARARVAAGLPAKLPYRRDGAL